MAMCRFQTTISIGTGGIAPVVPEVAPQCQEVAPGVAEATQTVGGRGIAQLGNHEDRLAQRLGMEVLKKVLRINQPFAVFRRASTAGVQDGYLAVVAVKGPQMELRGGLQQQPGLLLESATQFHLRPFNGHHCQIPVLDTRGRRTSEYREWLVYAQDLFQYLHAQPLSEPVLVVPELGNAAPAYGLSCFGDTWRDLLALRRDLRNHWRNSSRPN